MRAMLTRTRLWLITVAAAGVFVLSGCDPTVRDSVLNGVGTAATGLASTFIQAFFQSLIQKGTDTTPTVVQNLLDQLPQYFA
jgi:hypothetical protein